MQIKKLLGTSLALSLMLPYGTAQAELLKNFKFSGQLDWQATSANNVTDFATHGKADGTAPASLTAGHKTARDRIGDMQTRLMLNMDWDLLDDVHAKVSLGKTDRTWGTAGNVDGHFDAGTPGPQAIDAAGVLGATFVDQAYVKIDKVFGTVDATLGRQFYGDPGDLIVYFGPSVKALYGLPINGIDALRVDWSNDMVGVTGIAGKIANGASTNATIPQTGTDLTGINAMLKGHEDMNLGAYLYNRVIHNVGAAGAPPDLASAGGKNDNLWVLGAKGKYMMGNSYVSGEIAKDFGENRQTETALLAGSRNYTGWAFKLDAGTRMDMAMASVKPWAEFGYGSGDSNSKSATNRDFTAIFGDYRPGDIYGRFANTSAAPLAFNITGAGAGGAPTTLTNRVIWGLGVKATPASLDRLTVGLSLWDFNAQTTNAVSVDTNLGGNKHLATELDLDATWKHSENVSFGTGVAMAQPGGAVKAALQSTDPTTVSAASGIGVSNAYLGYFDVCVKF
ncbi:MAG: hypothetical protein KGO96_08045 [Elusimicrobia bacterium]|nr:hypothetical protein [Elusimicrobiota bacterium]MDE2236904.1 hypothetical protein [Elusimicrobiota bacterium]MDE2425842.1 hypothetical protein [Elusimicrobiota bacterium]